MPTILSHVYKTMVRGGRWELRYLRVVRYIVHFRWTKPWLEKTGKVWEGEGRTVLAREAHRRK